MNIDPVLRFTDSTNNEFYPTPEPLVKKMLSGIELYNFKTILEPSAGKGDILREIARYGGTYRRSCDFDIDCIEKDESLRQILKYNFSKERERDISIKIRDLEKSRVFNREKREYEPLSPSNKMLLAELKSEKETFFKSGIHVVFDDFLFFTPFKQYDLIIMNPPFSNGDSHLLKALDIQKRGGSVICLLNAETIRNPYTERRKQLVALLEKYQAQIEYIENAFSDAERKTDVEVALIKVYIPEKTDESDIYRRFQEAEHLENTFSEVTDLEVTDYIKAAINLYTVEVKAGLELIRQYRAMIPYMSASFTGDDFDKRPILRLTDSNDRGYDSVTVNQYLKRVRLKYWTALLSNPKFTGKLTSKLQTEYRSMVDKLADYEFNEFNIYSLSTEINAKIKQGIEGEIEAMFDRLTEAHTWYPETQKNRHYFDGWKTNKAHKIDKKVIVPCYGVYSSYDGRPEVYNATTTLSDIERILNFFDGNMTADVNLWETVKSNFEQGITKNISLKFFKATFYKKGTIHLVFTCPKLIERFNIYAGMRKKWLPPSYGKKVYSDLSDDEKKVVDSFQGEDSYNEVLKNANFYLSPVTGINMLLLEEVSDNA